MSARLVPLAEWAAATYGESAPGIDTLRRWAREARISPRPVKHGRTFFVAPDAVYVQPCAPSRLRLVDRIRGAAPKKAA